MTQEELNKIITQHILWLFSDGRKGKQADLSWVCLCNFDLKHANLRHAILKGTILSGSDLSNADMSGSILRCADLSHTNLSETNLVDADLTGASLDEEEQIRKGIILQKKMIGWKKCQNNVLVKLEIPKGAIVFSINNNKCRTNIAKVIEIIGGDGNSAISQYDETFIYRLNKVVKVKDFDFQYYNVECAPGIHFFKTQEEALNY